MWFVYYLILINLPLSIILFLNIKSYNLYNKAIIELEKLIKSD